MAIVIVTDEISLHPEILKTIPALKYKEKVLFFIQLGIELYKRFFHLLGTASMYTIPPTGYLIIEDFKKSNGLLAISNLFRYFTYKSLYPK